MDRKFSSLLSALLLSALLLFALVLFASCSGSSDSQGKSDSQGQGGGRGAQAKPALSVEAVRLTRGRLIERIESSGTVEGVREAEVVSETEGVIEEVNFELGQRVSPEETLLQVDAEIARLDMEQAQQELETARIDLQTKENLLERGGSSRAEVLRSRSAVRGADARYRQAVKAYENCSISSPISGSVASKYGGISEGNYLSRGSRIARIADLSSLRLEISLGESMIGLVDVGSDAVITVPAACEGESFAGKVRAVAAGSDPATGSYRVVIEWKNECGDRIKSGMSAEVTVNPREIEPVLIVPSSAVVSRGGRDIVFVAEELTAEEGSETAAREEGPIARMREVSLGRRVGNRTELLSGAEEGEVIILTGISGLTDKDPVRVTVVGESGNRR
ncbi:MAG: efflux RND transporter periplasmic adaptor subunit [Spirochaetaceae bacterium]